MLSYIIVLLEGQGDIRAVILESIEEMVMDQLGIMIFLDKSITALFFAKI